MADACTCSLDAVALIFMRNLNVERGKEADEVERIFPLIIIRMMQVEGESTADG